MPKLEWSDVKNRLPDWKKDRECDGDTVSQFMAILNFDQMEVDIARYHFPTKGMVLA